jgi:hypothetical protein
LFVGKTSTKSALFFVLVGLSASAPIMISPKQLSFYVVPSLPFFALAIGMVLSPILADWIGKIKAKSIGINIVKALGIILILAAAGLAIVKSDTPIRDRDMLADIEKMATIVPHNSTVELSTSLAENWSLMAYFHRKYFISLDPSGQTRPYVIFNKGEATPEGFEKIELNLEKFELAERINQ